MYATVRERSTNALVIVLPKDAILYAISLCELVAKRGD